MGTQDIMDLKKSLMTIGENNKSTEPLIDKIKGIDQ